MINKVQFLLLRVLLFLLLPFSIFSQQVRLTWPVNGSIFQQDASGNASIQMVLQAGYGWQNSNSYESISYNIQKLKTNGECQTINANGNCTSYVFTEYQSISNWTTETNDWKMAKINLPPLPKGWYRIKVLYQTYFIPLFVFEAKIGVGDVHFVAGQSNASGYGGISTGEKVDEQNSVQSYYSGSDPNKAQQDAVRNISISFDNRLTLNEQTIKGIPINSKFDKLESSSTPQGIYPNGRDSWYWAPFANKVAKETNTPVMIFNIATPNTSMYDWANNENTLLFQKFRSTLQMYGGLLGAKDVLWVQGENDIKDYAFAGSQRPSYLSDFKTRFTNLINWSKNALSPNLSWYVSNVGYTVAADWLNQWSGEPNLNNFATNCKPSRTDLKYTMTSPLGISGKQSEIINDNATDNIFQGVNTSILSECYRSSWQRLHYTGSSDTPQDGLNAMANAWYNALFNTNGTYKNNTPSVPNKSLLDITVSKDGSNNYVLHAPLNSNNQLYQHYFWVLNDNGIYNPVSTNQTFSTNKNNVSSPEFYVCYVSDQIDNDGATNGWNLNDLRATMPFVMKNNVDANIYYIAPEEFNIPVSQYSIVKNYTVPIQVSDVQNVPNWITVSGYGTTSITLTASINNGARRADEIIITPNQFPTTQNLITINQASAGSNCQVYLSSLTPSYVSQDAGTLHNNLSVAGNQLNIGGTTYNYGLGTHANSNIRYNLGGNYLRFQAFIGRDNEVNGCACGSTQMQQFFIKVDNVIVYNSGEFSFESPIFVDIPVENAQVLELIVDKVGDNYGDHVDWADAKLLCNNIPCFKTSALSSPTDDYSNGIVIHNVDAITGIITATNNIMGTANVSYFAGKSITLLPGFQVDNGTVFKAEIGGCY